MNQPCATCLPQRRQFLIGAGTALATWWLAGCSQPNNRLVLYCAQDQEFAELVLGTFTERTGLRVDPKFDTEADKSVSLYLELVQEKQRPRCDVHWNNEILSTIRLQHQGLLEPYESPSAESYPDSTRAADHTWQAFAARARILLVNTERLAEANWPRSLLDLADERWKGKIAMAKPQFGTSATQAACLFEVLGSEKARQFYRNCRTNQVHIEPGNKQVAEKVGQGEYVFGVTDTDDAMVEVESGRPVAIIFPDGDRPQADRMGTLVIPNTLAVIKNSPNPAGARRLVDYLLSAEVEGKLAQAASHQIPLNPKVAAKLPPQLEPVRTVKRMAVDFARAAQLWDETQAFLRETFARG